MTKEQLEDLVVLVSPSLANSRVRVSECGTRLWWFDNIDKKLRGTFHDGTFSPAGIESIPSYITCDMAKVLIMYRRMWARSSEHVETQLQVSAPDEDLVLALRRAEKRASLASKVATAAVALATAQALIAWAL